MKNSVQYGIGLILSCTLLCSAEESDLSTMDLGEIDRRLNNPLTSIWSLTFQNNTSVKTGEKARSSAFRRPVQHCRSRSRLKAELHTFFKLRAELQYSIFRPEDYGTEWYLRLQFTPVINNPFNK